MPCPQFRGLAAESAIYCVRGVATLWQRKKATEFPQPPFVVLSLFLNYSHPSVCFAIWIAGPFLGLLVLIYTRIIIELNIAVVNIAENTESKE